MEMNTLTRDETANLVSRDQILRRGRGQGNIIFPCSADHEQDWQPYPADPYVCFMCDHTLLIVMQGHKIKTKERHESILDISYILTKSTGLE